MTRRLEGNAKRLTAFICEDALYEEQPLYLALIEKARTAGVAGATVMRGLAGYGATSRSVTRHGLRMSTDAPLMVVAVDEAYRIAALAEVWAAMLPTGLVTIEDTSVIAYKGASALPE
jgi:PII-like signaling protein